MVRSREKARTKQLDLDYIIELVKRMIVLPPGTTRAEIVLEMGDYPVSEANKNYIEYLLNREP